MFNNWLSWLQNFIIIFKKHSNNLKTNNKQTKKTPPKKKQNKKQTNKQNNKYKARIQSFPYCITKFIIQLRYYSLHNLQIIIFKFLINYCKIKEYYKIYSQVSPHLMYILLNKFSIVYINW